MTTAAAVTSDGAHLSTAADYVGLNPEQRYKVVSKHFPAWLLLEPIEFPAHHSTYGWACLVDGCEGVFVSTYSQLLCDVHRKQFYFLKGSTSLTEFVRGAEPVQTQTYGWALVRRDGCKICGANREAQQKGYCNSPCSLVQAGQTQAPDQ